MRKLGTVVVAVAAALAYSLPHSAAMAKDDAAKVSTAPKAKVEAQKAVTAPKLKDGAARVGGASRLVREISAIPVRKIPPVLLNGASAVAIFPGAAKRDFMVGGGRAGGVLFVHEKEGRWSSPVFITISGGTLGWQIVGDPMDIVLVIKNRDSIDTLLKGKLSMDAKIAIEQGRLGLNMKGATAKELKAVVASYVRSRGAFVEDSTVAGTTLQIDTAANDAFYAKPKIDVAEIVSGKVAKLTDDVKTLQKQLADYAAIK